MYLNPFPSPIVLSGGLKHCVFHSIFNYVFQYFSSRGAMADLSGATEESQVWSLIL